VSPVLASVRMGDMDDQVFDRQTVESVSIGDLAGTWFTEKPSGLNEAILLKADGSAEIDCYNVGLFARERFRWEIIDDAGPKIKFDPAPPGWTQSVFEAAIYHDKHGRRFIRLSEGDEFYFTPADE
jgi:hypothetical protein